MKIICIEEHAVDVEMGKVVGPLVMKEAPYMAFSCTDVRGGGGWKRNDGSRTEGHLETGGTPTGA